MGVKVYKDKYINTEFDLGDPDLCLKILGRQKRNKTQTEVKPIEKLRILKVLQGWVLSNFLFDISC